MQYRYLCFSSCNSITSLAKSHTFPFHYRPLSDCTQCLHYSLSKECPLTVHAGDKNSLLIQPCGGLHWVTTFPHPISPCTELCHWFLNIQNMLYVCISLWKCSNVKSPLATPVHFAASWWEHWWCLQPLKTRMISYYVLVFLLVMTLPLPLRLVALHITGKWLIMKLNIQVTVGS